MNLIKVTLLVFSLSVLFVSCGDDDDGGENMGLTGIEGEWSAIEFSATTTGTSAGQDFVNRVVATSLDYCLTLQDENFQTNGSYSLSTEVEVAGMTIAPVISEFNNVEGSGAYIDNDTSLEIDGAFYELDINGMSITEIVNGPQTVDYRIDGDGNLIFEQNETISQTTQGVSVNFVVVSSSTWERK